MRNVNVIIAGACAPARDADHASAFHPSFDRTQTMTKVLEYFFSISSPWAFIGLKPFAELSERMNAEIRPHLTTVVEENGGIYSRNRPDARRLYWLKDLERWSRVRGREMKMEGRASLGDPIPASFMVIAAILDGKPWIPLTLALQEAFWSRAEDIGNPDVRKQIADAAGLDGAQLLSRERDDDVQARWKEDRTLAIESGVFGFPTVIVDGELYWGQDNLPFLEQHLKTGRAV
jgi:2-hydroxychromene-2-carboxylate isomerase